MAKKITAIMLTVFLFTVFINVLLQYPNSLVSDAAKILCPAATLFLAGIILLCTFLYHAFSHCLDLGLFFIAAALFIGMACLLLSSSQPGYHSLPSLQSLEALCFIMVQLFLLTRMRRRYRWILGGTVFLYGISVFLYQLLLSMNFLPSSRFKYLLPTLPGQIFAVIFLTLIVLAALEAEHGSRFFRIFLYSVGLTAAGCLLFCLFMLFSNTAYVQSLVKRLSDEITSSIWIRTFLRNRNLLFVSTSVALLWNAVAFLLDTRAGVCVLTLKYQAAQDSYHNICCQHEQVMILQHDLKNHLILLDTFLKEEHYQRARDYLDEIIKEHDEIPTVLHTDHHTLNIVLNSRLAAASNMGLRLNIIRAEAPANLPFSDKDLCTLLMNILDNAAAGALKSREAQPSLSLDFYIKNNHFCFSCKNSALKLVSINTVNAVKSLNPDSYLKKHGYGLKIIRRIVNKYGGILELDSTPDAFSVSFFIPLH